MSAGSRVPVAAVESTTLLDELRGRNVQWNESERCANAMPWVRLVAVSGGSGWKEDQL